MREDLETLVQHEKSKHPSYWGSARTREWQRGRNNLQSNNNRQYSQSRQKHSSLESQWIPVKVKFTHLKPRHVIIHLSNVKENILKALRETIRKGYQPTQWLASPQARREWDETLTAPRGKAASQYCALQIDASNMKEIKKKLENISSLDLSHKNTSGSSSSWKKQLPMSENKIWEDRKLTGKSNYKKSECSNIVNMVHKSYL